MNPILRPGTSDHAIWLNINENNEYRLPDTMNDWVVMDIGAHTGAFTYACLQRGVKMVYAYEPHPENFNLLQQNASSYFSSLYEKAVVGKRPHFADNKVTLYGFTRMSEAEINTGAASLSGIPTVDEFSSGITHDVEFIQFDRAIGKLSIFCGRRVDLVKLDCEGQEFDILLYSGLVDQARRYCGEFHEFPQRDYKIEHLERMFHDLRYRFEYFRHPNSHLGMFFATSELIKD